MSIFLKNNYKVIKKSKSKYLLSFDDYFLNMDIFYSKENENLDKISFYQDLYYIHIENLSISQSNSNPYSNEAWNEFELFDFR